ncbi:MAG: ATP-dependent RecD-like DNA helicase [Pseudomonadota bacterium]|nr:ATP-dependent RecD-like DNA helicase [Pseudomonadota bacterium]
MYADRLEGEVTGFSFKSGDGAFAVGKVKVQTGAEVTVVGPIAHLYEGQRLVANGQWVNDGRFGRQFKIETFLVEEPRTLRGLERYLAAAIEGVGPEIARRIVETFGLDSLSVLEGQQERLSEVPGVGEKTREKIVAGWARDAAGRELEVTLRGFGMGPALCRRIADKFGKDALAVVTRTPYRLVDIKGVGFRTADQIARANGIKEDDPSRVQAAVLFCLGEAEDGGSCYLPEGVLLAQLVKLDVPESVARTELDRMAGFGRVARHSAPLEDQRAIFKPETQKLEAKVARSLTDRLKDVPPARAVDVSRAEVACKLELHPAQRAAVELSLASGVSIITGGPGTGKTTILKVLLAAGRQRDEKWLCAAPTGRAARRLSESSGQEAKTLHRLLEYSMQDMDFTRNSSKLLEADGVLVDESSMLDLKLMAALLDALPAKCRLVLVGDVDQLPSVGAGQILKDCIDSGTIPVARLTEVYRQANDSGIVRNAHRINSGRVPESGEKDPDGPVRDFFVLTREDATDAQNLLLQVIQERLPRLGFDPRKDVQVLTPMHGGILGTTALNERLQAALNPDGAALVRGNRTYRVGDRVLQTRNDYDNDIFNGDVGTILAVEPGSLTVDFDGREVTLLAESIDAVELAYAISIHKSQGSEYPAVIVALHNSHFVMLRRNLLYTALTRARRFACLVASPRALRTAVGRCGGDERYTKLAERLRQ